MELELRSHLVISQQNLAPNGVRPSGCSEWDSTVLGCHWLCSASAALISTRGARGASGTRNRNSSKLTRTSQFPFGASDLGGNGGRLSERPWLPSRDLINPVLVSFHTVFEVDASGAMD
jgi:hypothetical protein